MPRRDVHNELVAALVVLGVLALLLAAGAIFALSLNGSAAVTATPSATNSATSTTTATPSATNSATMTATASHTPTSTARASLTRSITPSVTVSATVSVTASRTYTATIPATLTVTPTIAATNTITATATPSHVPTDVPSVTATIISSATPSQRPAETATDMPSATDTVTPLPTDTVTPTETATASITASITPSQTFTPSATATATWTPLPTIAPPPSRTPTLIPSATGAIPTPCLPPFGWQPYLVQPGDTLFSLALRANVSLASLENGNCLFDPSQLRAGQILYFPPGALLIATGTIVPTTPAVIIGNGCDNPLTRISAPLSGATLTSTFTVRGAASIADFSVYKLEISTPGSNGLYKTFFTGNTPVVGDGVLATLDPAPYVKAYGIGTYYIHLIVINSSFQVAPNTCTVYVRFGAP